MSEMIKISQKQYEMQCCLAPPCAFLTYPNEYYIDRNGTKELAIKEKDNCFCQKACHPMVRSYESEIMPRPGVKYTAVRDWAWAACCPACPCWMPYVKVLNASGKVIGVVKQECPSVYMCLYMACMFKGDPAEKLSLWRIYKRCAINCHTCCSVGCCGSVGKELNFDVGKFGPGMKWEKHDGETFKKVHSGCWREWCTAADNYELSLSTDNDEAALQIAAMQFLDMLFFENPFGTGPNGCHNP